MKKVLSVLLPLIAGYILGIVIGAPNLDGSLLSGDIGKVNKYNKKTVDPAIKAMEEKLQNDSAYLQGTVSTLLVVHDRMQNFSNIVEFTKEATAQVSELNNQVNTLMELSNISANAQSQCEKAMESIGQIMKGEENDFENAMNRTTLAYLNLSRQIKSAKKFVVDAEALVASKKVSEEQAAALQAACVLWANYCTLDAIINNDEEELAFWNKDAVGLANIQSLEGQKKLEKVLSEDIGEKALKKFEIILNSEQLKRTFKWNQEQLKATSILDQEQLRDQWFNNEQLRDYCLNNETLGLIMNNEQLKSAGSWNPILNNEKLGSLFASALSNQLLMCSALACHAEAISNQAVAMHNKMDGVANKQTVAMRKSFDPLGHAILMTDQSLNDLILVK